MRLFALILFALAGCSGLTPAPVPTGPWHQLNERQWQISPAEWAALPK